MPVTFNPGPSQISGATLGDITEIAESGLLSVSHRTDPIRDIVKRCVTGMRRVMAIPDDYEILFQTSATSAMDLVISNCVTHASVHYVAGAFAERFAATAQQLGRDVVRVETPWGEPIEWEQAAWPTPPELIALTHNETSTGAMWPEQQLVALRETWPDPLLAVDVTSSFGALRMDWTGADYWFGSVQKCLGLPAGLGFAIMGPRAIERARSFGDARKVPAWRDMLVLLEKIQGGDTFETPNVLGLALLERQMVRWDLDAVQEETFRKAAQVRAVLGDARFFVRDPVWRSATVHCLDVGDPAPCHERARAAGFELGLGYGPLKQHCIRIATFPAVTRDNVAAVLRSLPEELRQE